MFLAYSVLGRGSVRNAVAVITGQEAELERFSWQPPYGSHLGKEEEKKMGAAKGENNGTAWNPKAIKSPSEISITHYVKGALGLHLNPDCI